MVYYEESRTNRDTHHQPRRRHKSRHAPVLQPRGTNDVRYTSPEVQAPSPSPPRRRRWATGYIDRQSCPSYAYINARSRSPDRDLPSDTEYIAPPRYRTVEYIVSQEWQYGHSSRHRQSSDRVRLEGSIRPSSSGIKSEYRGSDVESLDTPPSPPRRRQHQQRHKSPPLSSSASSSASDLQQKRRPASSASRPAGSDTVSLRRSSSSNLRSDTRSIGSLGARSDVQEWSRRGWRGRERGEGGRRDQSSSGSDSEGGYISLDGYIGGSDCVSMRGGARVGDEGEDEDGGEGSDAVGSDVVSISGEGEGSDGVMGSDVESFDGSAGGVSEEDCIENEHGGYGSRYRRW